MKKNLFTLVFVSVISLFQAQEDKKTLTYGAKAGLTLSTWTGSSVDGIGSRTGIYAGGFVNYKFSQRFALQPELLYSMQGAGETPIVNNVRVDYTVDYITLPVMLKFYAAPRLNLEFGPQLALKVNDKVKAKNTVTGVSATSDIDVRNVDFGLNAGLGYEFSMGLGIEARYNFGLSEVLEGSNARTSVFSFGLSYRFK